LIKMNLKKKIKRREDGKIYDKAHQAERETGMAEEPGERNREQGNHQHAAVIAAELIIPKG
jgi:hypothetical protein